MRSLNDAGEPGIRLHEFVSEAWEHVEGGTPLTWNWHLVAMCEALEGLILDPRAKQNLLINVPPGTMKSLIMGVFFPAWVWLFKPGYRMVFASGTPSVVSRDSLRCRNLIRSEWYGKTFQPRFSISSDQDEKTLFANTRGGFRQAIGAGAAVTGVRADFLGVDDPNDAREIHSKAHRDGVNNWWASAFHNRVADPAKSKRAIVMQRLHDEDLSGYVLSTETGMWDHILLPMEYEPTDAVLYNGWKDPRTQPGELLFPERFPKEVLEAERRTLGSSGYAGQMQQRPVAAEGNRFKKEWWRFWSADEKQMPRPQGATSLPPKKKPKHFDEVVISVDCSFKKTDSSDYVAAAVIGRSGADKYVLHLVRERMGFMETKQMIERLHKDWPHAFEILVESAANGAAIVDALSSEIPGIIGLTPMGSKEARAASIEPQVEAGNVYLPEGAEWLGTFIDEFASFPLGKNDDIVDAVDQALIRMSFDEEVLSARALLGLK